MSTLYVSNLPASATEESLAQRFNEFGTVLSVKFQRDAETGANRRSGFVEMKNTAEAHSAASALNATRLDGRLLSVTRAARG